MLPTKGYFQDIECPYFDSACSRPYCHFRHRKKCQDSTDGPEAASDTEIPTYKPTPKSELANIKNHIPISYVPDLAFRPNPNRTVRPMPKIEKPTYKPTPLSILSSANTRGDSLSDKEDNSDNIKAIKVIKQNIASVQYNPEVSLQDDPIDINFEDLSAEFDLIDDIIDDTNVKSADNKSTKENDSKEKSKQKTEHKSRSRNDKSKSSRTRSKYSSSKSHKEKHNKNETSLKDKQQEKDRHKEKVSSKNRDKRRHSSKHKKDKEKSRERERNKKRQERDKHKSTNKTTNKESKDKCEQKQSNSSDDNDDVINFEMDCSDEDLNDEDETLLECYKIFNEYKPPETSTTTTQQTVDDEQKDDVKEESANFNLGKKRIAHGVGDPKIQYVKAKPQASPAQIMINRFKMMQAAQANNEQTNIINELKLNPPRKRSAPTLLEAAKSHKLYKPTPKQQQPAAAATTSSSSSTTTTTNMVDSILNEGRNKIRKIAPAQNVNSIQMAKARIDEIKMKRNAIVCSKKPAQSNKGTNRVAHVAAYSLSDIPDVLNADKSKLAVNVRTRFLTMLAEECCKLYLTKEDAYTRALNEEFTCYEKCNVLTTYKNSAMLAVSRLRKELQERERLGLGMYESGETANKDKSSELTGKKFYENIKGYLLTDEDLDLHGYPRESPIHGRAVIKNRKPQSITNLSENQRRCSRCSKVYMVDCDGYVMYREDCIYHPLKKRTLRGEQTYLCCKSNNDFGCATSNTHVCEMSDDSELEGFQTTMDAERDDDPRSHAVFALDCEMCYTIKGLELTRVTIVDNECKIVYETLVKPLNTIIDYNTTFSGITKEQMDKTSTSILQVQANILHLCNSKTILIGHSLESDLKALKIIHRTIIDTSVLFPHKMGLPHKRALRVLASEFLKKIIQNSVSGHDSAEDAITCMELINWKLKEELKVRGIK